MINRLKFCSFVAIACVHAFAATHADAQAPRGSVGQPPRTRAPLADDESPFADDPIDQPSDGAATTSPVELDQEGSPLQELPPPPAPLSTAAMGGLSASLGTIADSSSVAPNMIGDLFNAGTSTLGFSAKFEVRPEFSVVGPGGGLQIPNATALVNGISAPINGVQVTSLSNIGDMVRIGDTEFVGVTDLNPITGVTVQVKSPTDAATVFGGTFVGGPKINPTAPTSNGLIYKAANRVVKQEFSSGFSSDVDVEDLVKLEYIGQESDLSAPVPGEVAFASYIYQASVSLPVPSPGEVVGRYSIADNNSPLPQDRLFLDYNFFHNARITAAGIPVNRWAPGFESTFADGMGSIEFRAPMAITLTSAINTSGDDLAAYEFGDISFTLKGLLLQDDRFIASAGLGLTLPTADDFSLTLENNTQVVRVENQSVHILPFVAGSLNLSRNAYVQSFTQLDFDVNGNSVFLDEQGFFMQGAGQLANAGRLHSQSTVRFSNSAGYFLFRNRQKRVSDLAAVLEAHYTGTLNKSDSVGSANFAVGDPTRTLSVLNLTSGLHAYIGRSVVTTAYGVPVTEDRVFDGELRVFINRYF